MSDEAVCLWCGAPFDILARAANGKSVLSCSDACARDLDDSPEIDDEVPEDAQGWAAEPKR